MNIAIIPAAGSGTRFGGGVPKQFVEIAGAPVLIHTIRRFESCPDIDLVCVALAADRVDEFEARIKGFNLKKPVRLVRGGSVRSESIRNALAAVKDLSPEIVAIHDAVRPFVTSEMISKVVRKAASIGAAIVAQVSTDTIKEVDHEIIVQTLDRRRIFRAQTPQAFRYELLCRANSDAFLSQLSAESLTDDAMLVERLGAPVAIVEGSESNIKITTAEDLSLAEHILEQSTGRQGTRSFRVGIGYDIHRLVEGRRLKLGGVDIPFEQGLLGHSDGDSLTHAICDALLGAAGLGDIGSHFSDKDAAIAGIDSCVILTKVVEMLAAEGCEIENVDVTICAERPKMAPFIAAMRTRLSKVLVIPVNRINIKAKTNEGLDAVGRGEAIAAQAVALISCVHKT
ncbi:MAG: 2-C-methyl-D-erythritol 4-phosphate cytidylyltransferase [Acidobacteriota bacterium]